MQLRDDIIVESDGPLGKLGEKSDIKGIIQEAVSVAASPVYIHQIRDLLEGIKADAERQDQLQKRKLRPKQDIDIFGKKIVVFQKKQNARVQQDACPEPGLFAFLLGYHGGNRVIAYNADG